MVKICSKDIIVLNNAKKVLEDKSRGYLHVIGIKQISKERGYIYTKFEGFITKAKIMENINNGLSLGEIIKMDNVVTIEEYELESLDDVKKELIDICDKYGVLNYICYNDGIELSNAKII